MLTVVMGPLQVVSHVIQNRHAGTQKRLRARQRLSDVVFFCLASVGIMEVFYPVTENLHRAYF